MIIHDLPPSIRLAVLVFNIIFDYALAIEIKIILPRRYDHAQSARGLSLGAHGVPSTWLGGGPAM